jgi:hypothetical protein
MQVWRGVEMRRFDLGRSVIEMGSWVEFGLRRDRRDRRHALKQMERPSVSTA